MDGEPGNTTSDFFLDLTSKQVEAQIGINGIPYELFDPYYRPPPSYALSKLDEWEANRLKIKMNPFCGGPVPDSGFIGEDQSLRYVLAAQAKVAEDLGVPKYETARRVNRLAEQIWQMEQADQLEGSIASFTPSGKQIELSISIAPPLERFKGGVIAPKTRFIGAEVEPYPNPFATISFQDEHGNTISFPFTSIHQYFINNLWFFQSSGKVIQNGYAIMPEILYGLAMTDYDFSHIKEVYRTTMDEFDVKTHDEERKHSREFMDTPLSLLGQWYTKLEKPDGIAELKTEAGKLLDLYTQFTNDGRTGFETHLQEARECLKLLEKPDILRYRYARYLASWGRIPKEKLKAIIPHISDEWLRYM